MKVNTDIKNLAQLALNSLHLIVLFICYNFAYETMERI